jgi:hypothetical protein
LFFGCLAIFTKETTFVLPVLIWLLYFIFDTKEYYKERVVSAIKYSMPFAGFALLNTILHIYLFGSWGVQVPFNIKQNIIAATMSFFYLAEPLWLLELGMKSKIVVFLISFLIVSFVLMKLLFRYGIRGIGNLLMSSTWRTHTYLLSIMFMYMLMYTVKGVATDFYHYVPYAAFIFLMMLLLSDTFTSRMTSWFVKSMASVFVVYSMAFSPLFSEYTAWRTSSDIVRAAIQGTESALMSEKEISRIYLVNWPFRIGVGRCAPGRGSTILRAYSMNTWAQWSGIASDRDIEFIPVSRIIFPCGHLKANVQYIFLDNRIRTYVEGGDIYPSPASTHNDIPVNLKIKRKNKNADLVFSRNLEADERLFLYSFNGIKVIGNNEINKEKAKKTHEKI